MDEKMEEKKLILLEEWKDIRETIRYFGTKRFPQLTVYIAANGFMLSEFFKQSSKLFFPIAGILIGVIFFAMEFSATKYWTAFATRGRQIESEVGYLNLMSESRPAEKWYSATNATYAVYILFTFLWLATFALPNTSQPKSASDIVASAIKDAPLFATDKHAAWGLLSLNWDDSSRTYRLVLHSTTSPQTMLLTVSEATGKVVKVEMPTP